MEEQRPLIALRDITRIYYMGEHEVHALAGVSLDVFENEYVAIMGASGSGKSTLMNIVGCLDSPTGGAYYLNGQRVSEMSDNELANVRNREIGFVFQTFNLLARADCMHNVELPLVYSGIRRRERRQMAEHALESVGLADRVSHKPNELSGDSGSVSPWREPWSTTPLLFWPTNRQATSTRKRAGKSCTCSSNSTGRGIPCLSLRTKTKLRSMPAALSAWLMEKWIATCRWTTPYSLPFPLPIRQPPDSRRSRRLSFPPYLTNCRVVEARTYSGTLPPNA